jgi:hypothetical protein
MLGKAALFLVGLGAALFGWKEYRLAAGASAAPEPISVDELERGVPDNPYRLLRGHIPVPLAIVYVELSPPAR